MLIHNKMFQPSKIFILLSLLFIQNQYWSQLGCERELNIDKVIEIQEKIKSSPKIYNGFKPIVRLALHNVNKDDGTGGNSWIDIRNVVAGLSNYFQPYNICFVVANEDDINRDQYFEMSDYSNKLGSRNDWDELIEENRVTNAINIYFVKNADGGLATGPIFGDPFPSVCLSNFTGGIQIFNSQVLAHEIGHCLGLFHTHEKTINGIEEIPRTGNLKNCETAGDLLCDTPADFNLNFNPLYVDASCYYIGEQTLNLYDYEPDPSNLMSYSFPTCMTNFTVGQGERIRDFIFYTPLFDNYIIPADYNLTGNILLDKFIGVENTILSNAKHFVGNVKYEAGTRIRLTNGFQTNVGQDYSFNAKIKPITCTNEFSGNDGIITKPIVEISGNLKNKAFEEHIHFSISPNPTNTYITIKSINSFDENVSIDVLDINGKIVSSNIIEVSNYQEFNAPNIDFDNLKQGVYFLKIYNSKFLKTYKVVKCQNL